MGFAGRAMEALVPAGGKNMWLRSLLCTMVKQLVPVVNRSLLYEHTQGADLRDIGASGAQCDDLAVPSDWTIKHAAA